MRLKVKCSDMLEMFVIQIDEHILIRLIFLIDFSYIIYFNPSYGLKDMIL